MLAADARGEVAYGRDRGVVRLEELVRPAGHFAPRAVFGHLDGVVGIEPVGRLILDVDGRDVAAVPDDDLLVAARFDRRRESLQRRAEVQWALGRPDQAVADALRRHVGGDVELVRVLPAEERIRAFQGVGVIDDVAGPDVLQEEKRGQHAVVDLLVRFRLFLDDADAGGIELLDAAAVADERGFVDDEALIRRIEVEVQLRRVLHAVGGHDLAHAAEVLGERAVADHAHLVIAEDSPRSLADVRAPRLAPEIDADAVDPGGRGFDGEVADAAAEQRRGRDGNEQEQESTHGNRH